MEGTKTPFTGTILRIEPNGFGVIKFDRPIGPSANTHGIFSTTIGSTINDPNKILQIGSHVTGEAEAEGDKRKVAAVLSITLS